MRIGPLTLERRLSRGAPVQHATLMVTPVAQVLEASLRAPGLTVRWIRSTPHHVVVATLAGERRVRIQAMLPWLPIVAALPVLAATALIHRRGWPRQEDSNDV